MTELVQELAKLDVWVRLHYVYPYPHVDEILPMMSEFKATGASDSKILPYLDIPFQHSHPDVLRRMKRPASGEKNIERIRAWREACPNLIIRSTFIAGFPGETEAEFQHLLDFLVEAQLDRVGCFAYSPVDGATANALENPVPQAEREARVARFMAVQADISKNKLKRFVGKTLCVLVDKATPNGIKGGLGRSFADAPEIDGVVHIAPVDRPSKRYKVGDFINVRIDASDAHDLHGVVV